MSERDITKLSADELKRLRTRDGREVRIYTTQHTLKHFPVVGTIADRPNALETWMNDGRYSGAPNWRNADLVLPPAKIERKVWVNLYPMDDPAAGMFLRDSADFLESSRHTSCISSICIDLSEVSEGEGLTGEPPIFKLVRVK